MQTEIKNVDPEIIGGKIVECIEYNVRNVRLHNVLEQISRMLIAAVESDSNNSNALASPREVADFWAQWAIVKSEYAFAKENNDLPTGSHEYAFKISLLSGKTIQQIRNVKIKRFVVEAFNATRVMLSVDAANMQSFIDVAGFTKIDLVVEVVEKVMKTWLGENGKEGIYAPSYELLGEVKPDVDSDYASIVEPSSAMPKPKLADVADVE